MVPDIIHRKLTVCWVIHRWVDCVSMLIVARPTNGVVQVSIVRKALGLAIDVTWFKSKVKTIRLIAIVSLKIRPHWMLVQDII